MNAGQRSIRRLANSNAIPSRDTICTSCLLRLSLQTRRHAATATAAAPQPDEPTLQPAPHPPMTNQGPQKAYRLLASAVLSRPPMLTRSLTPFEKAFYLYQKRLNERLVLPFTRYFYHKKGTVADKEWKAKQKTRKSAARDIGVYSGYGDEAWNDEVLMGDETAEYESQIEALIADAEGRDTVFKEKVVGVEMEEGPSAGEEVSAEEGEAEEEGERKVVGKELVVERPAARVSEADEKGDVRSLSRKMDRVLYLLIQDKEGVWRFPEDRVYGRESLGQAAERLLIQSCGVNMNTWIVGSHPIGHHIAKFSSPVQARIPPNRLVRTSDTELERHELGEKVFFMKGRILAGQVDLSGNEFGSRDFAWLAKEEIRERVGGQYWSHVKNMLTER